MSDYFIDQEILNIPLNYFRDLSRPPTPQTPKKFGKIDDPQSWKKIKFYFMFSSLIHFR